MRSTPLVALLRLLSSWLPLPPKEQALTRAGQAINTATTAQREIPEFGRASSPSVHRAAKGVGGSTVRMIHQDLTASPGSIEPRDP